MPRAGIRRVVGRGLVVTASQLVNTLTNLVVTITCARAVGTAEYGGWAVVYAGYVLALQSSRAVVSTAVMVHRDVDQQVPEPLRTRSVSAALYAALTVSILLAPGVLLVAAPARGSAVAILVLLPLLLVQDHLRQLAFRNGRPVVALLMDLAWLLIQAAGTAALVLSDRDSLTTLSLVWAAGGALPAVAVVVGTARGAWRPRQARAFASENRSASVKLLFESWLGTGVLQLLPAVLALAAGYTTAGTIRASQTVLGPITIVVLALVPTLTISAVSMHRRGRRTWPIVAIGSASVLVTSGAALALLTAVPRIGHELVGESWSSVDRILLPAAIASALRGPFFSVPVILRATERIGDAVRLRLSTAVPALAVPVAGAAGWGTKGAAWGMALAAGVNAGQSLLYLRQPRRGKRRAGRPTVPAAAGPQPPAGGLD